MRGLFFIVGAVSMDFSGETTGWSLIAAPMWGKQSLDGFHHLSRPFFQG